MAQAVRFDKPPRRRAGTNPCCGGRRSQLSPGFAQSLGLQSPRAPTEKLEKLALPPLAKKLQEGTHQARTSGNKTHFPFRTQPGGPPLPKLGGWHPLGFNAAMCDASVHWFPYDTPARKLRRLILRSEEKP